MKDKKTSQILYKIDENICYIMDGDINNLSRIKKLNEIKSLLTGANINIFNKIRYNRKYKLAKKFVKSSEILSVDQALKIR